jgi:hypothetical protein
MAKRAKAPPKGRVPKAMSLIGGIGGPLTAKRVTPALSPGSLAMQRPYVFVPKKSGKGRKGKR